MFYVMLPFFPIHWDVTGKISLYIKNVAKSSHNYNNQIAGGWGGHENDMQARWGKWDTYADTKSDTKERLCVCRLTSVDKDDIFPLNWLLPSFMPLSPPSSSSIMHPLHGHGFLRS